MRRLARLLLNGLAALSLLLCVATVALLAWSGGRERKLAEWAIPSPWCGYPRGRCRLVARDGALWSNDIFAASWTTAVKAGRGGHVSLYPFAIAFAFGAALSRRAGRCRPKDHPAQGDCLRCGYDLTGNVSGVCPECGTAVVEWKA